MKTICQGFLILTTAALLPALPAAAAGPPWPVAQQQPIPAAGAGPAWPSAEQPIPAAGAGPAWPSAQQPIPAAGAGPAWPSAQQPIPVPAAGAPPWPVAQQPIPAAAAGPPWPVAQQPIPQAKEPEGPATTWDPVRFSLSAQVQVGWMLQDDARRLWGKQGLFGEGLSVSYEALRVGGKIAVGLDLSWLATIASTPPDSQLSQKTSTQVFDLGLTVRYQVFRWLSPYARVAGGMGWAALSIGSSDLDLRDRVFLYQGSAGAGLLFRSPGLRFDRTRPWPQVAFVGRVEGGYTMGNATDFSLKLHSEGSNKDPIPVAPVSVGEAARRFPYLRITVGVGF